MLRDEVLEASWRAGGALSEMRLDTADDVNGAVARYLELIKLAALVQRPGAEPAPEAIEAIDELLGRVASPEQRAAIEASSLDDVRDRRGARARAPGASVAPAREPSLEQFLPRRKGGLALSASDIDLYRTCPLKYKFARVFAIPAGADDQPAVRDPDPQCARALPRRGDAGAAAAARPLAGLRAGSLDRLLALFEAGWRRTGFGATDDELQYRDRAVAALARYQERHARAESRPVWLERNFTSRSASTSSAAGSTGSTGVPGGGYELIDYKTGDPARGRSSPATSSSPLPVGRPRGWEIEADAGQLLVRARRRARPAPAQPDDAERVERTVLEVAAGIEDQDFEPRPSYEICSWCDYRLICPASEA